MPRLEMDYRILGPLELRDGDTELDLRGSRQRLLLAVLLVEANHVVSTDRLVDILWSEAAPDSAPNLLQVYVNHVRRALEPRRERRAPGEILVTRPPGYMLRVGPEELDAHRFEALATEGRSSLAEPARADELLRAALAEWRGPALAEFADVPVAVAEAARLEERRLAAIEDRIQADLELRRHSALVAELEALVAAHPLREGLRGHLMLALSRSGRQAEALQTCADLRVRLREDLGIDPSPALRALERAILVQDPAATWSPERTLAAPTARVGSATSVEVTTATSREQVHVDGDRFRIGRESDNDLVIEGDSLVSRRHAELTLGSDGTWLVRDLGSTNGTFLNGSRLVSSSPMRSGDELLVGRARLRLVSVGPRDATERQDEPA